MIRVLEAQKVQSVRPIGAHGGGSWRGQDDGAHCPTRADLDRVTEALSCPVAVYEIGGDRIVVTEAEVGAVWARLVRPHPEEAIRELALIRKLEEREKDVPEEEIRQQIAEDIEAIRAEAIAKGIAIDDPLEAVVGD